VSTQQDQQAGGFTQQVPQPSFASARVEFTDGTVREFHVHKPLRADVRIPSPVTRDMMDADLGALPVALMPPSLPLVEVRLQAGIRPGGRVITVDSRAETPASLTGRVLRLLAEAVDLRKAGADGDAWRTWEYKAEALMEGARPATPDVDYPALTGKFWVSITRNDGTEDRGYPAIAADGSWRYHVPAGIRLFGASAVTAGDVISGKIDISSW
jgi:hypothetical protein